MARTEIGRALTPLLTTDIQVRSADVVKAGRSATLDDYRYRCGVIAGLDLALQHLDQAERTVPAHRGQQGE